MHSERSRSNHGSTQLATDFPPYHAQSYFFFARFSLSTFFTIFCSSIKNALVILSFTQFEHLDPPYARWTVFLGLEI